MTSHDFPAVGRSFEARFGDLAFRLDFDPDGRSLHFSAIGAQQTVSEDESGSQTVQYIAVGLREDLFLVFWQEAAGTTVTHVEDFAQQRVHSNITSPDGSFLNLSGSLTPLEDDATG